MTGWPKQIKIRIRQLENLKGEINKRIIEESEGMQSLYATFREDPVNTEVRILYSIHLENWNLYRKQYNQLTAQLHDLRQTLTFSYPRLKA